MFLYEREIEYYRVCEKKKATVLVRKRVRTCDRVKKGVQNKYEKKCMSTD